MSPSRKVANPIAVRRFNVVGEPGRTVVLSIGMPQPDPKSDHGDWECAVGIEGVAQERIRHGRGVDAVQALQDAMVCARHELDRSGLPLAWLNEGEPGDLGLPLPIPTAYGVCFQHRIEKYVARQALEIGGAVTAVLRERARRRARRGPA